MKRAAAAALAAVLAAPAGAAGEDPQTLLAQLEARLLGAKRVAVEIAIEATGAVAASLRGRTELLDRNRASLAYLGTFAGKPVELVLQSNGQTVEMRNGAERNWDRVERESNRALLLGLLRMGQLHNLARLARQQPPDRAAGGVDTWVVLDSFRPATYAVGGDLEGMMSIGFDVVVAGQPSGSARLWVDPVTSLPRRRQLTVRLPQGEMVVTEDYTRFEIE